MADPLSLLQKYHTEGRTEEIVESDNHIIFGDLAWPKDVRTNFRKYGTEKDGTWEYYTLDCLLFFVKNIKRRHPEYVRLAKGDVPIVTMPDRRDLIGYLEGNIPKKDVKSIDQSAPLHMPATNFKRTAAVLEDHHKDEDAVLASASKKPRLDSESSNNLATATNENTAPISAGDFKRRLADKLDGTQEGGRLSINKANLRNLSEKLTTDKIAEIKAKAISYRRTRIKPEDADEVTKGSIALGESGEVGRESKDIFDRERVWRNRTTILQSTGKNFFKSVNSLLQSVKAREEGKSGKVQSMAPHMPGSQAGNRNQSMGLPSRQNLPNYNRYDQEKFQDVSHGFNIETTGTFSGMTLKSVTEGNQATRKPSAPGGNRPQLGSTPHNSSGAGTPSNKALSTTSPRPGSGTPSGKRPSRTPIIIIPAAPKSLITMYNAKEILQELRFVSTEDKKAQGAKRENELLITRRKDGGVSVPYRIIDNPAKLTNADWDRVVAVFVMGQAWQFKGWPWDGNPTVIFSKISAYHLKWDDSNLEKNIANWAVNVIPLSREKRHLDRAKLMAFWERLDKYMVKAKPHLRF